MDKIKGALQVIGQITGALSAPPGLSARLSIPEVIKPDIFTGEYEYTPSDETQIIEIEDKMASRDIIINPIPSNYGLVTWDGSALTVS